MKRALLFLGSLFVGTTLAASSAHAVANHAIEQVQQIVKNGKVVGARVHLLVSPESYKFFRINLGPHADVPAEIKSNDTDHRKLLAGASRTRFLLKKLKEVRDIKDSNGTHELYVDIMYGKGVKAGDKVNLLSAFSNKSMTSQSSDHMHIYGAWDGPVNSKDATYVIELPAEGSQLPKATKKLAQQ
jgi:hypothetical protein